MKILDGKIVRDKIGQELKAEISRFHSKCKLVIVQVGNLAESNTYIAQKIKFGQKIGAIVDHLKFPQHVNQKDLISKLLTLNSNPLAHGVIVQLPIPKHLDKNKIIDTIDPIKDVDGQTATNVKLLFEGASSAVIANEAKQSQKQIAAGSRSPRNDKNSFLGYIPATTKGILTLLDYYKIPVAGKHVVIIGRSQLVGKPTALALLNRDATVTVCHSKTKDLATITKAANILVVAAGRPRLITKDHVKKGQVIIDVGINVVTYSSNEVRSFQDSSRSARTVTNIAKPEEEPAGQKLIGDVDFESVAKIVAAISPVPGGCGPMTVASLFQNLMEAYNRKN